MKSETAQMHVNFIKLKHFIVFFQSRGYRVGGTGRTTVPLLKCLDITPKATFQRKVQSCEAELKLKVHGQIENFSELFYRVGQTFLVPFN